MGSNLVIVAIPADDDPIWKVSSEKKPHLTICFLGDANTTPNIDRIMLFVEHAVTIAARGPFYLEVDHRDVLGPDQADVFMFRKDWSFRWLNQFRNQLLKDNDIRKAYESTEQYPEYQPHITLGYPAAPAHEDKMPEYGISMIRFDRIGVWTGDFEGPDWRLEWPENDMYDEAAWGVDMDLERAAAGRYTLEHVGVKGMKWGVRNKDTAVTVNGKAKMVTAKKAAKLDTKFTKNASTLSTFIKIHNSAAEQGNAHDIDRINNKPEYKNKDFTKPSPLRDKYYKEHADAFNKRLEEAATSMKSPTGKKQYDVHIQNDGSWNVTVKDVQHAAGDPTSFVVKVTYDSNGYITKLEPVEPTDSIAQAAMYGEAFSEGLMHHGIKGMKWGVRRKEPPSAVPANAMSRVPRGDSRKTKIEVSGGQNHSAHPDAIKVAEAQAKLAKSGPSALSNNELRDVATRIQLETQVRTLTRSSGHKFVRNLLGQQGKEAANQAVRQQVKKHAFT